MIFNKKLLISCLVASLVAAGLSAGRAEAQEKPAPLNIGRRLEISSTVLNETREVWVALPSDYEDGKGERYPVIIQLGDPSHFRYSAPIVEILSKNGHIPKCLVVGVPDPTPRHHYRDSTPTKVGYLPASGGAAAFLAFLKDELLPRLDAEFRTVPFRILCGHGLSGLFAVWALRESAGAIGAAVTDSASMTFDKSRLVEEWAATPPVFARPASLYLAVGDERETVDGLRRLAAGFEKSRPNMLDWVLAVEPDEDQGTVCIQAFYKGIKWIFRDWRLPVAAAAQGLEAVKAHYSGLSKRFGYDILVTEARLSERGFELVREQRFDEAALVFELAAATYPGSPTAEQNLGFLYERTKDFEKAASAYERAAEKADQTRPELAKFLRMQAERLRKAVRK